MRALLPAYPLTTAILYIVLPLTEAGPLVAHRSDRTVTVFVQKRFANFILRAA